MKKNTMMRVASVLLIAVLLTTSAISGTFAKYTTQDAANDAARVAKWGVAVQVAGTLYEGTYNTDGIPVTWTSANTATVSASATGTDVVAPGTQSGAGMDFSINGVPEVSGTVTTTISWENVYLKAGTYGVMVPLGTITQAQYNAIMASANDQDKLFTLASSTYSVATAWAADTVFYTLEDYVVLSHDYYPVEYVLTGDTNYNTSYSVTGTNTALNTDTLSVIVNTLTTGLGTAGTATVEDGKTTNTWTTSFVPNTDLDTTLAICEENISWKWDFDQNADTDDGDDACMYCKADTILGNLQAGTTTALNGTVVKLSSGTDYVAPVAAAGTNAGDFNLETEFSIDITVTQVD